MGKTYELNKPIQFGGKEVKEINLDFDSLNGGALIQAERLFVAANQSNEAINIREYSQEYQAYVASQLSGLPITFFHEIDGYDFSQITTKVKHFFLGVDS